MYHNFTWFAGELNRLHKSVTGSNNRIDDTDTSKFC